MAFSIHRNDIMLPFVILQQWQHIFYFRLPSFYNSTRRANILSWKPSTISVRLDFLKSVQIFNFFNV